jgi:hypothetical protein
MVADVVVVVVPEPVIETTNSELIAPEQAASPPALVQISCHFIFTVKLLPDITAGVENGTEVVSNFAVTVPLVGRVPSAVNVIERTKAG